MTSRIMLFKAQTVGTIRRENPNAPPLESYRRITPEEMEGIYLWARIGSRRQPSKKRRGHWAWDKYAYMLLTLALVGIVVGEILS